MGVLKSCVFPSVLMLIFLQEHFITVSSQGCDTSSDTTQCSEGERCVDNVCEKAEPCDAGPDCGVLGEFCEADYCQLLTCTTTGQCVHGQICSDYKRKCVYPINLTAQETTRLVLNFSEPGTVGTYEEITWYKGGTGDDNKIVVVHPAIGGGEPQYHGDYCSGSDSCETSDKAELNPDTGALTIYSIQLSDDDYYYYKFYTGGGALDTGAKYEIILEVYVTPNDEVSIEGISDEMEVVGTPLDLTCTINRIKPEAAEIYWTVNGVRENGSIKTQNNSDGTFNQTNKLEYTVVKEDEGEPIICIVVPVYGDQVEVDQIVNPGYAPSGKPNLQPPSSKKHVDEDVVLTCNKPDDDGNPDCEEYSWNHVDGNGGTTQNTNTWKFPMQESSAGNYTCTCGNTFGDSDVSNKVEVIFLAGPAPAPPSGGVNMAIIGGAVGGVVFVILIVVIVIFIIRRRRKPSKGSPDDETGLALQSNGRVDQGPIYAQPDKSRKLRPQRGLDNGPEYANANALKGENPYENTAIDNNNPPDGKQENGGPDGVVYTEVNIRNGDKPEKPGKGAKPEKPGKPKAKERTSLKKPKVHQAEEPTVYAEITPVAKKDEQK